MPSSYDFHYQINDTTEYLGSAWICTLRYGAYITNAQWDKASKTFTVEGFFAMRSDPPDTTLGIDGINIFLFNPASRKTRDLGRTLPRTLSLKGYDGFFKVTFIRRKGDVLVVGIPGRLGVATAFDLDKVLATASD